MANPETGDNPRRSVIEIEHDSTDQLGVHIASSSLDRNHKFWQLHVSPWSVPVCFNVPRISYTLSIVDRQPASRISGVSAWLSTRSDQLASCQILHAQMPPLSPYSYVVWLLGPPFDYWVSTLLPLRSLLDCWQCLFVLICPGVFYISRFVQVLRFCFFSFSFSLNGTCFSNLFLSRLETSPPFLFVLFLRVVRFRSAAGLFYTCLA